MEETTAKTIALMISLAFTGFVAAPQVGYTSTIDPGFVIISFVVVIITGFGHQSYASSHPGRAGTWGSRGERALLKSDKGFLNRINEGMVTGRDIFVNAKGIIKELKSEKKEEKQLEKLGGKETKHSGEVARGIAQETQDTASVNIHATAIDKGSETIGKDIRQGAISAEQGNRETLRDIEEETGALERVAEAMEQEPSPETANRVDELLRIVAEDIGKITYIQIKQQQQQQEILDNDKKVTKIIREATENAAKVVREAEKKARGSVKRAGRKFIEDIRKKIENKIKEKEKEIEQAKKELKEAKNLESEEPGGEPQNAEVIIEGIKEKIDDLEHQKSMLTTNIQEAEGLNKYISKGAATIAKIFADIKKNQVKKLERIVGNIKDKVEKGYQLAALGKIDKEKFDKKNKEASAAIEKFRKSPDPGEAGILIFQVKEVYEAIAAMNKTVLRYYEDDGRPIIKDLRYMTNLCVQIISGLHYLDQALEQLAKADEIMKQQAEKILEKGYTEYDKTREMERLSNINESVFKDGQMKKIIEFGVGVEEKMVVDIKKIEKLESDEYRYFAAIDDELANIQKVIEETIKGMEAENEAMRQNIEKIGKVSEEVISKMRADQKKRQKPIDFMKAREKLEESQKDLRAADRTERRRIAS